MLKIITFNAKGAKDDSLMFNYDLFGVVINVTLLFIWLPRASGRCFRFINFFFPFEIGVNFAIHNKTYYEQVSS